MGKSLEGLENNNRIIFISAYGDDAQGHRSEELIRLHREALERSGVRVQ